MTVEEKALIAISELKQAARSLDVQRKCAKELYEALDSRCEWINEKIKELEC